MAEYTGKVIPLEGGAPQSGPKEYTGEVIPIESGSGQSPLMTGLKAGIEGPLFHGRVAAGMAETIAAGAADLANTAATSIYGLGAAAVKTKLGTQGNFIDSFKEEQQKTYNGIRSSIPYAPETEAGIKINNTISELLGKGIQYVGDYAYTNPYGLKGQIFEAATGRKIEPSPVAGAAAQAAALLATLLAPVGASKASKAAKGVKAPVMKNLESDLALNMEDPHALAQWAEKNYPETMKNLQASSIGKVKPMGPGGSPAVDAFNKLHRALNEELKIGDGGGQSLSLKFQALFQKLDPKGEVPIADRLKITDGMIKQFDDLNKLANSHLTPQQLVEARLVRPELTLAETIAQQTGVKPPPTKATTAASAADFKAALEEHHGYVVDPRTQQERPMTAGEYLDLQVRAKEPKPVTAAEIIQKNTIPAEANIQAIVEHMTGQKLSSGITKAEVAAAVKEPSGVWVADASGQIERQLTTGEYFDLVQKGKAPIQPVRSRVPAIQTNIINPKRDVTVMEILQEQRRKGISDFQIDRRVSNTGKDLHRRATKAEIEAEIKQAGVPGGIKFGPRKSQAGILWNDDAAMVENNIKAIQSVAEKSKNLTAAGLLTESRFTQLDNAFNKGLENPTSPHKTFATEFTKKMLDTAGPMKHTLEVANDLGAQAKERFNLVKGASGEAEYIFDGHDSNIYKHLTKEETSFVDKIVRARTIIAIDLRKGIGKHVHELRTNGAEAEGYLNSLKTKIGEAQFAKANAGADAVFRAYHDELANLHENGVISDESYLRMRNIEYSPTEAMKVIDPERQFNFNGATVTVRDSGIPALRVGETGVKNISSRSMLAESIIRARGRVARNDANVALADFAKATPENGFVEFVPVTEWSDKGVAMGVKNAPAGWVRIDAMVKGQQQPMYLRNDMAEQWVTHTSVIEADFGRWASILSGSAAVKTLATTVNPFFALKNIPKDAMQIWVARPEYSSTIPIYLMQLGKDMAAVAKDAATKKGRWVDFVKEKGSQEYLSQQGPSTVFENSVEKMTGQSRRVYNALTAVNSFSEAWTRLALRERAINNGAPPWRASAAAREYMDFSDKGSWVRAVDTVVPYLSAKTQGVYSIGKQIRRDPARFAWQATQLFGLGYLGTAALIKSNPEAQKQIPIEQKMGNFVIAPPDMFLLDPNGNKRHVYFTLPVDNSLVPIQSLGMLMAERELLGKIPNGAAWDMLKQSGISLDGVPVPVLAATASYVTNYDFWKNGPAWQGKKVNPEAEIIPEFKANATPGVFKLAGGMGLSPERARAALGQVMPRNVYTSLLGEGVQAFMEGATDYEKAQATELMLTHVAGISGVVKLTHPFSAEIAEIDKAERENNTTEGKQFNTIGQFIFRDANKQGNAEDEFKAWVKMQPPEDVEGLVKQFTHRYVTDKVFRELKTSDGIPSRNWWAATSAADPKVRGQLFYQAWVTRSPEQRQQMFRVSAAMARTGVEYMNEPFQREFASELARYGDNQR
jgi:hypothetical protein